MIKKIKNIFRKKIEFTEYKKYWEDRYAIGGTSGAGSYGVLAEFKAEIINKYIKDNNLTSVIEFGCGDGNQLKYMNYEKFLGLDVSQTAIDICKKKFKGDKTKNFIVYNPKNFDRKLLPESDLVICLDVLYHITNDDEFEKTLQEIFSCSARFVILYTTLYKTKNNADPHIKNRNLMPYLDKFTNYKIDAIVPQKHKDLSLADFVILKKR